MRLLRAALDSLAAMLELFAAEAQAGVSAIEAASVDKFNTELRALTTTEAEREDLRESALLIAKLGFTVKDVVPMARAHYLTGSRLRQFSAQLSRYADELTPGGNE